jgi:hypothetical protein
MTTIRDMFHNIGNWHNKISLGAGVTKVELKQKFKDKPLPQEIENLITRLTELERHSVEASKALNQLKDVVYGIIDPDTDKPKR